jgi:hypothetical protein
MTTACRPRRADSRTWACYQTMYLVATAMKLAPCALGSGNSALFAEATGVDRRADPAVGEFMLGTRP